MTSFLQCPSPHIVVPLPNDVARPKMGQREEIVVPTRNKLQESQLSAPNIQEKAMYIRFNPTLKSSDLAIYWQVNSKRPKTQHIHLFRHYTSIYKSTDMPIIMADASPQSIDFLQTFPLSIIDPRLACLGLIQPHSEDLDNIPMANHKSKRPFFRF